MLEFVEPSRAGKTIGILPNEPLGLDLSHCKERPSPSVNSLTKMLKQFLIYREG